VQSNYDQQTKGILFWNELKCLPFLVSIAEITGINTSTVNNDFALSIVKVIFQMLFLSTLSSIKHVTYTY